MSAKEDNCAALMRQVAALTVIAGYAKHSFECWRPPTCTCGLDAALAELEAARGVAGHDERWGNTL